MKNVLRRGIALLLALSLPCVSTAFAATKYATLELGSRGSAVTKMQKALLALGFDPNGTDGKFGPGTENAVIAYQASKGIEADGKAGTQTLTLLYAEAGSAGSAATGTSSSGTLEQGATGAAVTELQTKLKALGYYANSIDGSFGSGTRKAVIAFQKANGLTADGKAGTRTLALLYSVPNSAGTSSGSANPSTETASSGFTRTLRKGYQGADVSAVQTRLQALGYYAGAVDGKYGNGSIAAVTAFQQANGLTADGKTGSITYAALFSAGAIAAGTASATPPTAQTPTTPTTSTTDGTTMLYAGSSGEAVTQLQQALSALEYKVSVTGSYDDQTVAAVKQFQSLNSLSSDGVAGAKTLAKLYSGSAAKYTENSGTAIITDDTGKASGPSTGEVRLLHWYNEIKPSIRSGQTFTVFDPATSLQWSLKFYSLGHHADSEPLTLTDTQIMYKAFGNTNTWTPKPVYVLLPSGTWTLASMHNVPHLKGSIKDNGFDGHLCVHFFRDMAECQQNDPNYGVQHQNAIRKQWKKMTGEDITD